MPIESASSFATSPALSTQILQRSGERTRDSVDQNQSNVSSDRANTAVDRTENRLNQIQENRETERTQPNTSVAETSNLQNAREGAELSAGISTGEEIDTQSPTLDNALGVADSLRVNQAANRLEEIDQDRLAERQRDRLENDIRESTPRNGPPSNIDVFV